MEFPSPRFSVNCCGFTFYNNFEQTFLYFFNISMKVLLCVVNLFAGDFIGSWAFHVGKCGSKENEHWTEYWWTASKMPNYLAIKILFEIFPYFPWTPPSPPPTRSHTLYYIHCFLFLQSPNSLPSQRIASSFCSCNKTPLPERVLHKNMSWMKKRFWETPSPNMNWCY